MKNKIILRSIVLFASLAAACLTACTDDKGANGVLSVDPASLSFEGTGGRKEFKITAGANVDWSIESDGDWVILSPSSGSGDAIITVTAKPNGSETERKTRLDFFANNRADKPVVEIVQRPIKSGDVVFNVTPLSLAFEADGLSSGQVVEVDTNLTSWECHTDQDWIILTPDVENGRILVNVKENPYTRKLRIADFVISAPGTGNVSIAITQEKNFINRLLGEWSASEWFYFAGVPLAIANDHIVTITKIDAGTVRIDNVMNINHQIINYDMPEAEYGTYCDFIIAGVDSKDKMLNIDIPYKLPYKWYNDKYDIYYSRVDFDNWSENFHEMVWPIRIEEVNDKLEMKFYGLFTYPGTTYKASFCSLAVNSTTQEFSGAFAFTIDTKWVKQYDYSPSSLE